MYAAAVRLLTRNATQLLYHFMHIFFYAKEIKQRFPVFVCGYEKGEKLHDRRIAADLWRCQKKKNVKIKYALRFAVKCDAYVCNVGVALGEKCVLKYIHASMTVKRRTQYAVSVIICDLFCFL